MKSRCFVILGAMAALVACSDLHLNPASSFIQTPIVDPSFQFDIMPVLSQTCATSHACHLAPPDTTRPNLESDSSAYATLVNVMSHARPGVLRVKPGFADSSFFYLVLHDSAGIRLGYPYRMPLTRYPLPFPTTETIKNWINLGAKNN
ncbi:MAG: hypothetical protein ACHQU1_05560 [Gemmatimonadales bacterium]